MRYVDKSTLVSLRYGGAELLIAIGNVASMSAKETLIAAELTDGTRHEGELSDYDWMQARASWGTVSFPQSMIVDAEFSPDKIPSGIDDKGAKAIEKLFENAAFPGELVTQKDVTVKIDAFVITYSTNYDKSFAAIGGIPCKVGNSLLEINPSKVQALKFLTTPPESDRRIEIAAIGGTTVQGSLVANEAALGKYYKQERTRYKVSGVLARTAFGYVSAYHSEIKEIRR